MELIPFTTTKVKVAAIQNTLEKRVAVQFFKTKNNYKENTYIVWIDPHKKKILDQKYAVLYKHEKGWDTLRVFSFVKGAANHDELLEICAYQPNGNTDTVNLTIKWPEKISRARE
jgi:hypothetical protein